MSNTYNPDPRPRLARATRFFARLASFDLECPHCGDVYQVRSGSMRARGKLYGEVWDPSTGRFHCTNKTCSRTYILGILAWPVGTGQGRQSTPQDQVPSPRHLAQLRKEGGGWWMSEEDRIKARRPHETNLTTEPDRFPGDEED